MASNDPKTPVAKPANQRGAARLAAVQALYQMDVGGSGLMEIVAEYENHRLGQELDGDQYLKADPAWFRAIVSGVVDTQRNLDPEIRSALTEDWPLSRLDATLRAILRAGAWEIEFKPDVPAAVLVNEYVDIARAFYEEEEPRIVNAVLDRLARRKRQDGPGKGNSQG
ncbi:MAG: transcription antitermination factor NusB [Rhizobiales bacterium]|nr:transcription antitermination factor NusB [Hyphomicrobiales bacterium]